MCTLTVVYYKALVQAIHMQLEGSSDSFFFGMTNQNNNPLQNISKVIVHNFLTYNKAGLMNPNRGSFQMKEKSVGDIRDNFPQPCPSDCAVCGEMSCSVEQRVVGRTAG